MTYSRDRRDLIDYGVGIGGAGLGAASAIYGGQAARARMIRGNQAVQREKNFKARYTTEIPGSQLGKSGAVSAGKNRTVLLDRKQVRDLRSQGYAPTTMLGEKRGRGKRALGKATTTAGPIYTAGADIVPYETLVKRNKAGKAQLFDSDQFRAGSRASSRVRAGRLIAGDTKGAQNYLAGVGSALINKNRGKAKSARNVGDYFGNLRKAVSKKSGVLSAARLGGLGLAGGVGGAVLASAGNRALRDAGYY